MIVGRLKSIKDLILNKLDSIQSKVEQIEQVSSTENTTALLNSSVFLVDSMQRQEKLNQDFQAKILHQVNAIHRQGMIQHELLSDVVSQIHDVREQVSALQEKINRLEEDLEEARDMSKV
jgi:prophage DNA circulation protein